MLRRLLDAFWSEHLWLPANTTWQDIANGPHKTAVYAEPKDLLYHIPFTLILIILRHLLEKYFFAPLGKSLGVKDTKRRNATHNSVLEAAFRISPCSKDTRALSKQLGMTERQVERWWRVRRSQDKPTTLVKFCENTWRASFYFYNLTFGLYMLWDKEWLWNIEYWYIGYPHQGITNDIWWYYTISASYYWSLTIYQLFLDGQRNDFWEMFVHHVISIAMLSFSWVGNLHRIGTLVVLLHDCAICLEIGKAAKYAHFDRFVNYLFVVFIVMWTVSRIIIFPFYIIRSTSYWLLVSPVMCVLNLLLWLLLSLNIFWTWLIMRTAYRALNAGHVEGDIRSSSSEISDSPTESNLDVCSLQPKHGQRRRRGHILG